jgi:hypothetical protein
MNFADHPPTIGRLRSDRTGSCTDWSPRDVLIEMLRRIDAGETDIDAMVVCWRARHADRDATGHFLQASPDPMVTLGLLSMTAYKMQD